MAQTELIDIHPDFLDVNSYDQLINQSDVFVQKNLVSPSISNPLIKGGRILNITEFTGSGGVTMTGICSFTSFKNAGGTWNVDSLGRMWQGAYTTYDLAVAAGNVWALGLGGISFWGVGTMTGGSIVPKTDDLYVCGSNDLAWGAVYSHSYVTKCNVFDKLDTLSLLKNIKAKGKDDKGNDKLDHSTLPDFLKVNESGLDLGKYVDLLASAIKQLTKKVEKLESKTN